MAQVIRHPCDEGVIRSTGATDAASGGAVERALDGGVRLWLPGSHARRRSAGLLIEGKNPKLRTEESTEEVLFRLLDV